MKNVTGLDVARGLTGSWGTLAVMTEVTFKVVPLRRRPPTTGISRTARRSRDGAAVSGDGDAGGGFGRGAPARNRAARISHPEAQGAGQIA